MSQTITKVEENAKVIRIPVAGEEGKHSGHKIRTIVVSAKQGIKALYCVDDKKIITYIFLKSKGWTLASAKKWVREHAHKNKNLKEIHVDQLPEFTQIVCVVNDETKMFEPSSPAFMLEDDIADFTTGMDLLAESGQNIDKEYKKYYHSVIENKNESFNEETLRIVSIDEDNFISAIVGVQKDKTYHAIHSYLFATKFWDIDDVEKVADVFSSGSTESANEEDSMKKTEPVETTKQETMELIKLDKQKQTVYGVFLWPEKADHDGDVISAEDIEKVAHDFIVDYRDIDEMHKQETLHADIVESFIAWEDDIDYYGKKLTKGAWAGAIKIHDREVWDKVLSGEYKAFSVRISGVREPITEEGGDE